MNAANPQPPQLPCQPRVEGFSDSFQLSPLNQRLYDHCRQSPVIVLTAEMVFLPPLPRLDESVMAKK